MEYMKGLYHFVWIKGVVEIIMSFFIIYNIKFGSTNYNWIYLCIVMILLIAGIYDLRYFLKIQELENGNN
jgi:hypothetical protein